MKVFRLLHLLVEVDLAPFVDDFHLKTQIILDQRTFISALACSPPFSFVGPLGMVYELLQNYFVPNDFTSGFDLFFEVCAMWAHCSRSCSTFSIAFAFYISTPNIKKKSLEAYIPL
jgi:hypothetical protein